MFQEVTKNKHTHYFQCFSRNLFSEGRGKAVTTRYNKLQYVTRCYKKAQSKDQFGSWSKVLFSKWEHKLLQRVAASYNALQEVTRNRHVHCIWCRPNNLFFEGRGKVAITRYIGYNALQDVTKTAQSMD